ncbi:MAG: hypothetical protein ACM3ZQ_05935 [Bacillota bacterium]
MLAQHNIQFEHYVLEELSTVERLNVKKAAFAAGVKSLPFLIRDGKYYTLDEVLAQA